MKIYFVHFLFSLILSYIIANEAECIAKDKLSALFENKVFDLISQALRVKIILQR